MFPELALAAAVVVSAAPDLFPLSVGRVWHFTCVKGCTGVRSMEVLSAIDRGPLIAYQVRGLPTDPAQATQWIIEVKRGPRYYLRPPDGAWVSEFRRAKGVGDFFDSTLGDSAPLLEAPCHKTEPGPGTYEFDETPGPEGTCTVERGADAFTFAPDRGLVRYTHTLNGQADIELRLGEPKPAGP